MRARRKTEQRTPKPKEREEQCEGQESKEQEEKEEPGAKRLKEEPQQEDEDRGRKDNAAKDIGQMSFWEVYNAEAYNCMVRGEEQPEDTALWGDSSGKNRAQNLSGAQE